MATGGELDVNTLAQLTPDKLWVYRRTDDLDPHELTLRIEVQIHEIATSSRRQVNAQSAIDHPLGMSGIA